MSYEELSAQQAAIDKAIERITAAEGLDAFDGDVYALTDASKAWALISQAITLHNKSVLAESLAVAAVEFVKSPSPDAYALLVASVEEYSA